MSNSLPMHERRPLWVETAIDVMYQSECERVPSFSFCGALGVRPSYDFGAENSDRLAEMLRQSAGRPITVLDVGTGCGVPVVFHRDQGDDAQGISAYDYRDLNPSHPLRGNDQAYLVGNAEWLVTLPGVQDAYDLVMSSHMLHHLADPLGAYEQMANKVGAAGLLCVDYFDFADAPTPGVTASAVVESMQSAGFMRYHPTEFTEADLVASAMPTTVWLRAEVSAPVRFPVDYGQNPDQPFYVPAAR